MTPNQVLCCLVTCATVPVADHNDLPPFFSTCLRYAVVSFAVEFGASGGTAQEAHVHVKSPFDALRNMGAQL